MRALNDKPDKVRAAMPSPAVPQDDHPPAETNLREDGSVAWPHAPHRLPPVVSWGKGQGNGVLLVPYSGAFRWGARTPWTAV